MCQIVYSVIEIFLLITYTGDLQIYIVYMYIFYILTPPHLTPSMSDVA